MISYKMKLKMRDSERETDMYIIKKTEVIHCEEWKYKSYQD